jgi:hypothetical protein
VAVAPRLPFVGPPEPPLAVTGRVRHAGPEVRVSEITGDLARLDPASVTVNAPFPAKPVGTVPDGWKLVRADERIPAFRTTAELAPGSTLTFEVRPHLLVPADGRSSFAVAEPGFVPTAAYRQTTTVAALLGAATRRLAQEDEQLDVAIRKLQQILDALPPMNP